MLQCGKTETLTLQVCKNGRLDIGRLDIKEKIQKFRIQFLQGQVNMMEIVEEYSIIYIIYIIYIILLFFYFVVCQSKKVNF